jgi:hypothetical protein
MKSTIQKTTPTRRLRFYIYIVQLFLPAVRMAEWEENASQRRESEALRPQDRPPERYLGRFRKMEKRRSENKTMPLFPAWKN